MSENKQIIKEKTNENGKIYIKKEAFRNMLTHVLRFGSNALEKSLEVMGVCLGKIDSSDGKITVNNSIPIMHGLAVSVGFSKKEIELFQQIENQYKEKIVGWYISRPGWGLDFTDITIANHQYFQNEKFPNGFCIVFDHTLLIQNEDLLFEVYRLNYYAKTDKYSSVNYEVEIPSSLEYFKWIQKFMEDFQKKNPILIKEINEIIEKVPEDLQEIPLSEITEEIEENSREYPEITSIVSSFKQGSEKFSEKFLNIFQMEVGNWVSNIEKGNSQGSEYISKSVSKIREVVVSGFLKVSNWFKKTLNDIVYEFKNSVSNYVDKRIEDHKEVTQEISELKENLISNLNSLIDNKIKNINSEIETVIESMKQELIEATQINIKVEEVMKQLDENLVSITNKIDSFTNDINKTITSSLEPIKLNFDEKIEKLNTEMEPFKNNYSEIRNLLEKLQKIITDFRNLT
ncbi:MAG: hypothetical protein ACFE9Z_06805 [Promethearchaeota archaeon]